MSEPPYGEIEDLLQSGQVVPFLGAGVNFGMRTTPGAKWDDKNPTFLPSGVELSRFLASKSNFPSADERDRSDLAKVASYFAETSARSRLCQRLHEVFDRDFEPCGIHNYLAGLEKPTLIVTTNYDDLTEQAFIRAGKPYDLVIHPTDHKDIGASVLWWRYQEKEPEAVVPNKLVIDLNKTTVIYKMHGTVDRQLKRWDSYVITEEDYVDFLSRMMGQSAVPAPFMRHFKTRHFLFMGYGLNDWNLRVVLHNLRMVMPDADEKPSDKEDEQEDLRSWAIQFGPSDLEIELWQARKVRIYNVDINEFVKRMQAEKS